MQFVVFMFFVNFSLTFGVTQISFSLIQNLPCHCLEIALPRVSSPADIDKYLTDDSANAVEGKDDMMASPDNPDEFEKPGAFSGGIRLNLAWRMAAKQYMLIAVGA